MLHSGVSYERPAEGTPDSGDGDVPMGAARTLHWEPVRAGAMLARSPHG